MGGDRVACQSTGVAERGAEGEQLTAERHFGFASSGCLEDVLEGEAEHEHWKKISEAKSAGMKNKKLGKMGGRKKFGKRHAKRGNSGDEPAAKVTKTEA